MRSVTVLLLSLTSNNRITNQGALCIAKGLEGNNTVEIVKVITSIQINYILIWADPGFTEGGLG